MARFLLRRIVGSLAVLLAVSLMAYFLIYLAPGDPATIILARRIGRMPTLEQVRQLSAEYGLDRPVILQYLSWVTQAIQGDLGLSIRTSKPVLEEIGRRFGYTALLSGVAMSLAVIVAIPTGIFAAWRKNTIWDQATRAGALLAAAIPDFWLAFLLILAFSISLGWLPSHGAGSARNLILPAICLAMANAARLNRLTRSGLLEVEREKYLLAARARGLTRRTAWVKHGFPNIVVPVVTLIATLFGGTFAASIVIENVFAWPGMGFYFMQAVNYRDLPVIQGLVIVYGLVFVAVNLVADLAYVALDPRIRLE